VCMCERVCMYHVFVLHIRVRVRELVCVYIYLRWHHLVIKVRVCVYVCVCVCTISLSCKYLCVCERVSVCAYKSTMAPSRYRSTFCVRGLFVWDDVYCLYSR